MRCQLWSLNSIWHDLPDHADLLLDVQQGAGDFQVAFDRVVPFLSVLEDLEFAIEIDRATDDLDIELLGVDVITNEDALHHPQDSQFFESHVAHPLSTALSDCTPTPPATHDPRRPPGFQP